MPNIFFLLIGGPCMNWPMFGMYRPMFGIAYPAIAIEAECS